LEAKKFNVYRELARGTLAIQELFNDGNTKFDFGHAPYVFLNVFVHCFRSHFSMPTISANGWRVSKVPFTGILASALSADPGPDRGRGRQAFNRLLAEVTLRWESCGW
jgi:hypothetical protein